MDQYKKIYDPIDGEVVLTLTMQNVVTINNEQVYTNLYQDLNKNLYMERFSAQSLLTGELARPIRIPKIVENEIIGLNIQQGKIQYTPEEMCY